MFTEPNAAKRGKKREGRGCLAWQPSKQQGLPHTVEVVHGSGFISDWKSRGEEKEQGKRPSCLGGRPQQERLKRRAHFSRNIIGGESRA